MRNEELYSRFKDMFALPFVCSVDDAIRLVLTKGSLRAYISYDEAWRYVNSKYKGSMTSHARNKKNTFLFEHVYNTFVSLKKKCNTDTSDKEVFSMAMSRPAPSYGLSFTHAKRIIFEMRKRKKDGIVSPYRP